MSPDDAKKLNVDTDKLDAIIKQNESDPLIKAQARECELIEDISDLKAQLAAKEEERKKWESVARDESKQVVSLQKEIERLKALVKWLKALVKSSFAEGFLRELPYYNSELAIKLWDNSKSKKQLQGE